MVVDSSGSDTCQYSWVVGVNFFLGSQVDHTFLNLHYLVIKVSCFSSISPIGPLVYRENRKAGNIIGTICFSSVSLNGKHILQKTNIQYSFYNISVLWSVIVIRSISRSLSHYFNLKVIKKRYPRVARNPLFSSDSPPNC